ncbi:phage virion morphogenesis protein [Thalassotalea sp. 1_MG-2023]|uniref:phage virion morphogenesis protein n=1 Tax=Thalassotalea sp. 1_MG-2023 TaxID=3062680 RepID=UPI0026E2774E|nr:phage virion morphogenesis protein [Thalassotalea sp. 1_MG-2023]MDO6426233.1 phage virion morphogenesis protein [Thalassotalea sp. 1_MG-2023]
MLSATTNKAQTGQVLKELKLLTLNPQKRRRILRGAGRKVRRDSKKRITKQKDLQGKTWQGRANGKKTKMLRKLGKNLQVHTSPNKAQVTFGNKLVGQIARAHQQGVTLEMTAKEAAKKYGTPNKTAKATRQQAKSLRQEGYKIRKNKGKGWKNPSLKWIQENLTFYQAGLVLRTMRDEQNKKTKWSIPLPERSFLGQEAKEYKQLKNYMLSEAFRIG